MGRGSSYTKQEELILFNESLTIEELSNKLNRSIQSIRYKMSQLNIRVKKRKRKYLINEEYFNSDSDAMYYIVGFTMADGSIEKFSENKQRVRYGLAQKDIEILEFIKNEISPTSPIKRYDRKEKGIEVNLNLFSSKIVNSLEKFGIICNKTGKEELKNIPNKYIYSYIRGLFDGDGTTGLYQCSNSIQPVFRIYSSNEKFLKDLRGFEGNNLGTINIINPNFYSWSIRSSQQLLFIYDKIYQNATFSLERKKNIMTKIKKYLIDKNHG